MPDSVMASVIVCTYTEARLSNLRDTIASLERQDHGSFEIVVVVDHNPELLACLRKSLPDAVRLCASHERKGLSGARNSGIAAARGRLIAFIDDDATAEPDWLTRLAAAHAAAGVIGSGGAIIPAWEGQRQPGWFPEEFLWVVGCTYRGMPGAGPIRNVIGCNMAFNADVFGEVGGFDTAMGRVGTRPLGCEETELCIRATNRRPGAQIVYVPEAVVNHRVPPERQTAKYFLSRCYSEGISKAFVRRLVGRRAVSSELAYGTRTIPTAIARNTVKVVTLRQPAQSFGQIVALMAGAAAGAVGFAYGHVALARGGLVAPQEAQ
jgi:GT2 family glycosyltransferase